MSALPGRQIQAEELTLETKKLAQVATGDTLKMSLASIERRINSPIIHSQEIEASNFQVLHYEDRRAIIKADEYIRNFTQDPNTGKRDYYSQNWYMVEVELVKEANRWKVKHINAIDYDR